MLYTALIEIHNTIPLIFKFLGAVIASIVVLLGALKARNEYKSSKTEVTKNELISQEEYWEYKKKIIDLENKSDILEKKLNDADQTIRDLKAEMLAVKDKCSELLTMFLEYFRNK